MPASPLRPTVFYFCRLGDMVMLTAMLDLLHRRYGLTCNVIGTGSWSAAIYPGNPDVAEVWSFGRHLPFLLDSSWPAVRRALRESDPGPIYVCERHYRQLPRIRRMLALSGINPARCIFISDEFDTSPEHLVDRLSRFATRTPKGINASDYPCPPVDSTAGPRLFVLDSERAERDEWLRRQGWDQKPYILIQPGNHRTMGPRRDRWRRLNADDKAWPMDRWVSLLHKLHEYKNEALLMLRGSPEEVPMLTEIQAAAHLPAVVVTGQGLRPLFALCEGAHSVISVDTGPAHAAAALRVPLVVLYGAEPQRYWLPRSPSGSPVIGVGGAPIALRADQVPVEAVFDAWCTLNTQVSKRANTPLKHQKSAAP
jgi:ADP-heptose:LPS heptosyltransferase